MNLSKNQALFCGVVLAIIFGQGVECAGNSDKLSIKKKEPEDIFQIEALLRSKSQASKNLGKKALTNTLINNHFDCDALDQYHDLMRVNLGCKSVKKVRDQAKDQRVQVLAKNLLTQRKQQENFDRNLYVKVLPLALVFGALVVGMIFNSLPEKR